MINKDFNSIIELLQSFPNEQSCVNHLEQLRWEDNVISPFDEYEEVKPKKKNYQHIIKH